MDIQRSRDLGYGDTTTMTEQIIKNYFCDHCGAQIDPNSDEAIRCFIQGRDPMFVVRLLKTYERSGMPDITVATTLRNLDFCNTTCMKDWIDRSIALEKKQKGLK